MSGFVNSNKQLPEEITWLDKAVHMIQSKISGANSLTVATISLTGSGALLGLKNQDYEGNRSELTLCLCQLGKYLSVTL